MTIYRVRTIGIDANDENTYSFSDGMTRAFSCFRELSNMVEAGLLLSVKLESCDGTWKVEQKCSRGLTLSL